MKNMLTYDVLDAMVATGFCPFWTNAQTGEEKKLDNMDTLRIGGRDHTCFVELDAAKKEVVGVYAFAEIEWRYTPKEGT